MIRTSRLLLRPYFAEDARELFARIADERVVRMLSRAPWPYTMDHAREFCACPLDPFCTNFVITLPEQRGAPIIGGIGLELAGDVPELGYWLAPDFWRQGYISEAVTAVLEKAALLGFTQVCAGHFADNPASGAVLRKAGFAPTGEIAATPSQGRGGQDVPTIRYACELALSPQLTLMVAA